MINYYNELIAYLNNVSSIEYYILIVVEDLIRHFNFKICEDKMHNDIRTIKLSNILDTHTIIINSIIISQYNQPLAQSNEIVVNVRDYEYAYNHDHDYDHNHCKMLFSFFGKYYKKN